MYPARQLETAPHIRMEIHLGSKLRDPRLADLQFADLLQSRTRPSLRSVDSQVIGRVIEPRKLKTPGAFVVDMSGGRIGRFTPGPAERDRSDRGRRARTMTIRVPQEPGRPRRLHRHFRLGNRNT